MPASADTTALLAHELREVLGRLVRRLRAEGGPAFTHFTVLGRLDREGPESVSDLAAAHRMRPQSMAQTVRDLEEAGLVSRRPDPADARRTFIELTPTGLEELRATRAQREDWLTRTLDRELDPHELEVVREALALLDRVADG